MWFCKLCKSVKQMNTSVYSVLWVSGHILTDLYIFLRVPTVSVNDFVFLLKTENNMCDRFSMQHLHDFVYKRFYLSLESTTTNKCESTKAGCLVPNLKHPNGPAEQNIIIKQMKLSPLYKPLPMLPSIAGERKRRAKMCGNMLRLLLGSISCLTDKPRKTQQEIKTDEKMVRDCGRYLLRWMVGKSLILFLHKHLAGISIRVLGQVPALL